MEIKCYSLSTPLKKRLGKLIKLLRQFYFDEARKENGNDQNPYTKLNFCKDICHYHTLTKLENEYVREDYVYHQLLDRLDLRFQVREEVHEANMVVVRKLAFQYLDSLEYFEDKYQEEIYIKLLEVKNDCLASLHLEVLNFSYEVFYKFQINKNLISKFEKLLDVFDDIFRGIIYLTIGYSYYRQIELKTAEKYYLKAIEIFQTYKLSIGLIYFPLVNLYIEMKNYYDALQICNVLEEYYIKTSNRNRLLIVYLCLIDYYLFINSLEFARKYTDELEVLLNPNDHYYMWILNCKWGNYELRNYREQQALVYYKKAYSICENKDRKLMIINRILICLSLLKAPIEELNDYLNEGYNYYLYASDLEKKFFTYFINKINNRPQYYKYVHESILPQIKDQIKYNVITLFFYRDMYIK